tara:strand:- start:330 stop:686 length:357 start_codon:yes stop_codon:yes gene_type:complete
MIKLKKLLGEKVEITPDKEGPIDTKMDIENNPFEEGNLSEADYLNITIPSQVRRWMKKFIAALKGARLNRIKTISILFQVIQGLGLDIREIQMYIPKIKAQIRRDKKGGEDEAEEGSY